MSVRESAPTTWRPTTYLLAENLIDGRAFFQRRLGNHLGAHFLHVDHEGIERLLDVPLSLPLSLLHAFRASSSVGGLTARARRVLAQLAAAVAITVVTIAAVFVAHTRVIIVARIGAAARRTAAQLSVDATGHRLGTVLLFHAEVASVRGAVAEQTGQAAIGRR